MEPGLVKNLMVSQFELSLFSFDLLYEQTKWQVIALCYLLLVHSDFILLECSYDAGPAASCRTLEAHMANWIWAAFQLKPGMELGNVIRVIKAGVDTNDNSAMARVLKVPQLTHRTSCDVIESGADMSQRIEFSFVRFLL